MNKTISRLTLALGVGVAALVGTMPTAGAVIDAKGPDCAEIIGGSGTYTFGETPLTRVATSRLQLQAPACAEITYRLVLTYTTIQGMASTVQTTSYVADGLSVVFRVDVPEIDAPSSVHAVVTTAKRSKALDEANAQLIFGPLDGGGGGSYQG